MILTLENYGYNLAQIFVGFELKCSVTFWLGREGVTVQLGDLPAPYKSCEEQKRVLWFREHTFIIFVILFYSKQ